MLAAALGGQEEAGQGPQLANEFSSKFDPSTLPQDLKPERTGTGSHNSPSPQPPSPEYPPSSAGQQREEVPGAVVVASAPEGLGDRGAGPGVPGLASQGGRALVGSSGGSLGCRPGARSRAPEDSSVWVPVEARRAFHPRGPWVRSSRRLWPGSSLRLRLCTARAYSMARTAHSAGATLRSVPTGAWLPRCTSASFSL